jgi:hypothetical protein
LIHFFDGCNFAHQKVINYIYYPPLGNIHTIKMARLSLLWITIITTIVATILLATLSPVPVSAANSAPMSKFSQSDVAALLNSALSEHKAGHFEAALRQYASVVPFLSGKSLSSVHSNMGALYLNVIGAE